MGFIMLLSLLFLLLSKIILGWVKIGHIAIRNTQFSIGLYIFLFSMSECGYRLAPSN